MRYYFHNGIEDVTFETLEAATNEVKDNYPWVMKIRDTQGGEYYI